MMVSDDELYPAEKKKKQRRSTVAIRRKLVDRNEKELLLPIGLTFRSNSTRNKLGAMYATESKAISAMSATLSINNRATSGPETVTTILW